jgi:pSer/pThr/pTyr-binding forkhead associated (FHA) protein
MLPLEALELVMGREPGLELQIDSPGVSRRHARLRMQEGGYLLEDLGSSNGTFVNGQRLAAPHILKPGDMIGLGLSVSLEYQVEQPSVQATLLEGRHPSSRDLPGKPCSPRPRYGRSCCCQRPSWGAWQQPRA